MRNIKLSLIATLCITGFIATNASALVVSNTNGESNNVALLTQIVKSKNIDKMVTRANNLDQYTEQYILLTGKIPHSVREVERQFNLSNTVISNYTNGGLTLNVNTTDNWIKVSHLFNAPIDATTLKLLENSSVLSPNATVDENPVRRGKYNPDISYTMSPVLINFINQIKMISSNPNNVISTTAPSDTRKTWYQPDGSGHFNVYKYVNGQWKNVGDIKAQGIVVNSPKELENYNSVAQVGTKAYVKNGDNFDTYVFDGKNWGKVATAGNGGGNDSGGLFNGTATIKDLATTIFNKAGGSVAAVIAPHGEWKGSKNFVKKDASNSRGYWISKDGKYAVFNNILDMASLIAYFKVGTYGYVAGPDGEIFKLQKQNVPGKGYEWVYLANNLQDALNYLHAPESGVAGNVVYVKDVNAYEQRRADNKVLQPVLEKKYFYTEEGYFMSSGEYFISSGGRNLFNTFKKGAFYLTKINDCTDNTCYINDTNQKIDGFNVYFYTPDLTQKNLNHLTDALVLDVNQPVVNQTYNVYDEVVKKYGDIFHRTMKHSRIANSIVPDNPYPVTVYLYVNANIIGKHGKGGNTMNYGDWNNIVLDSGETGDSAIQIGNFPNGSNINIINKATICGGGGGGGAGISATGIVPGGSTFSNGQGGNSINGFSGQGGNCGQGGGQGGVIGSILDTGKNYIGASAYEFYGGGLNGKSWVYKKGDAYTVTFSKGGNGGCAIAVPSKTFLDKVHVNIYNSGQIDGAVLNQLLHWNLINYKQLPVYNGKNYCIR